MKKFIFMILSIACLPSFQTNAARGQGKKQGGPRSALRQALQDQDILAIMAERGMLPEGMSTEEFQKQMAQREGQGGGPRGGRGGRPRGPGMMTGGGHRGGMMMHGDMSPEEMKEKFKAKREAMEQRMANIEGALMSIADSLRIIASKS